MFEQMKLDIPLRDIFALAAFHALLARKDDYRKAYIYADEVLAKRDQNEAK